MLSRVGGSLGDDEFLTMSFKICTIGCGEIAFNYHGPSYVRYVALRSGTELAACCDVAESKAAAFEEQFGFARHYTDFLAMLRAEKPDAVCLMVPAPLTCELSCQILELGYPLLVEKPPGRTVEEIDRMIVAAEKGRAPVQVAFNRRHVPLVRHLKHLLTQSFDPGDLHHVRYDLARVGRTDADFSLTAIHGVDAGRFLASSDYRHVRFHYQELPHLGPTTANIFMDCTFVSGATAHLSFCPVAGVVIERATVCAHDHSFFLNIPIWGDFDALGRLQHLMRGELKLDVSGKDVSSDSEDFVLSGFYDENASFFDAVRDGRHPSGDLEDARQSVEIAQCIRERKSEYILS